MAMFESELLVASHTELEPHFCRMKLTRESCFRVATCLAKSVPKCLGLYFEGPEQSR